MEYNIKFDLPDELDVLVNMEPHRRKYLNEKIAAFLRELLAQEMTNGMEKRLIGIQPEIDRE